MKRIRIALADGPPHAAPLLAAEQRLLRVLRGHRHEGVESFLKTCLSSPWALNEEGKRALREAQPQKDTRRLAIIFCTGQFTGHTRGSYTFHPTSKEWFQDEFEPFARSDIKILIFEALRGSSCVYKTNIGSLGTRENVWQDNWVDPLAEFTRLAHGDGMRIFASMRFIGPQFPMNVAPISWAPFYKKHPEWTMRKAKERKPSRCSPLRVTGRGRRAAEDA